MLHILILILKIIGIIIAVILGILLLLIAIFLFVPVHYEVQGRCDGALDSLKGKVQVTWLLHLVRADILYKNGKMKWRLRFAWLKRGNTGAGKKQKEVQTLQKQAEKAEISGIEEEEKTEISEIEEEEKSNHEKSITETDKIEKNEPEKLQKNLKRIWQRRRRYAKRVRMLRNLKNGKLKKEFLKKKNPWTVKRMEASIRGFFRGFRR